MPTYEYACKNCGHRFEKFQSFSDSSLTICPECDTESLRKVFSPAGIVFKGSGWYINDSRKSESSTIPAPKSDDSSSSSSSTTTESKPESKPETKTESKSSGDKSVNSAA
jgi:putative FmdB family regulatory protein